MANAVQSQFQAYPSSFPASSKTASSLVDGIHTIVSSVNFADKILITISQSGKLAHWVHVPLANTATDPMTTRPLANSDSGNSLLPMSHLTATTILGGTKRDDETIGQTLATTIASAILMKQPQEERLLVLGLGLENSAEGLVGRTQFDQIVSLVLDVL